MPRRRTYIAPVDEKLIGKRLRELRQRRGLSQTEIAEKLGINQTLVSQYERGKLRLHGALVAAFAKALRVTSDEILGLKPVVDNGIFRDRRFLRRLERVSQLPRGDKQAILKTLDLILKNSKT